LSLQRIRDLQGQNPGSPVVGGPLGSPPSVNGKPVDPGALSLNNQTGTRESHVLNDAILTAATELSRLPRGTRKIIFVVSSGYEYGSRRSIWCSSLIATSDVDDTSRARPLPRNVSA
jgi:hypothetical protein